MCKHDIAVRKKAVKIDKRQNNCHTNSREPQLDAFEALKKKRAVTLLLNLVVLLV